MPIHTINISNNTSHYFITCTVHKWYYLFDRNNRWRILADSLTYCIQKKDLKLYAFVFMLNHLHLLFSSPDAAGFIRDFKKFTAKELKKNIQTTEPHILQLFSNEKGDYHFWQSTNMPILIESEKVLLQKVNYIQNNPVRKEYVAKPEHWYWSSANPQCMIPLEKIVL